MNCLIFRAEGKPVITILANSCLVTGYRIEAKGCHYMSQLFPAICKHLPKVKVRSINTTNFPSVDMNVLMWI